MLFSKSDNAPKDNAPKEDENRILQNPKILEVNLIKEEMPIGVDWKRNAKYLLFALFATALIIVELYLGLDWWQKDEEIRLEAISAQTTVIGKEVSDFRKEAADALAYQEKTVEVGSLLDNHVYWTNFFTWLEKNTLSTVSYGGFSGRLDGNYSLSGRAGSFAEVSWQVKRLLDDPLTISATVDTVSSGASQTRAEKAEEEALLRAEALERGEEYIPAEEEAPGVGFTITLEVSPEIFKK